TTSLRRARRSRNGKRPSTTPTNRRWRNFPTRKNRLTRGKGFDQPRRGKVNNRQTAVLRCAGQPTRPREGRNFGRMTRVGFSNRREVKENATVVLFSVHRVDGFDVSCARRDAHSRQGQGATAITTLDTITQVRAPLR